MEIEELNNYKHLRFDEIEKGEMLSVGVDTTKKAYRVFNKHDDIFLGTVEWFNKWNKYVFYPANNTVFHDGCMNKISSVLTQLTKEELK